MLPTRDDNETRKRLLAIALSAPPVMVIDNIEGAFGFEVLAGAITAGSIADRVLGASEHKTVPFRSVSAITGNNIQLQGDFGRRVIPIEIDPKMEHPEDRRDFRYPALKEHVAEHRPALYIAALTILRAYFVAGRPRHPHPEKGSFETWDRLVRGAIIWVSGVDPAAGVERIRESGGDLDLERLRALVGAWWAVFADREVTMVELFGEAITRPDLKAAIDAYAIKGDEVTTKWMGSKLAHLRGRQVGDMRIEHGGIAHGGSRKWRVAR